ncbi:MAG: hypothetical protein P1P84_17290 [Deferrisomatales bacterium]|nr:hypothetical protein [Deferrisomatales bacterium]
MEALWAAGVRETDTVPTLSLQELTERVARAYGVDVGEIRRRRRLPELSDARAVTCYLAVRRLGYKGVDVGVEMGLGRAGARARKGDVVH